jgi:hypothetical protein
MFIEIVHGRKSEKTIATILGKNQTSERFERKTEECRFRIELHA